MRAAFQILLVCAGCFLFVSGVFGATDTDADGMFDNWEASVGTDPYTRDTDGDGFSDGEEMGSGYDPLNIRPVKRSKRIEINLSTQRLTYFFGAAALEEIKISSGIQRFPTPIGKFSVLKKRPIVHYRGVGYFYPNTKWNLLFKTHRRGNYFIHGAYWHSRFGHPMSHGCVNVSYKDMPRLYAFADATTTVLIYGTLPRRTAIRP